MKKVIFTLALLLCALLPANGALADAGDVFYISVDACEPGSEYLLMLCEEGVNVRSIAASDILFIDQMTADSYGRIEAAIVFPDFTTCVGVAGGVFTDGSASPRTLGSYTAARLPGRLDAIGEEAFSGTQFTHVYLSEYVTAIGPRAFANCGALKYVYIPASVTNISETAFAGTAGVTIGCEAGSTAYDYALEMGIPTVLTDA